MEFSCSIDSSLIQARYGQEAGAYVLGGVDGLVGLYRLLLSRGSYDLYGDGLLTAAFTDGELQAFLVVPPEDFSRWGVETGLFARVDRFPGGWALAPGSEFVPGAEEREATYLEEAIPAKARHRRRRAKAQEGPTFEDELLAYLDSPSLKVGAVGEAEVQALSPSTPENAS